jgi:hypothetical protein
MSAPNPDPNPDPGPDSVPKPRSDDTGKLTVFGEPVWKDVMKSLGCGLSMLLMTAIVGGALAIAIIAPWGRSSFDCSIYCVLRQYLEKWFF